METQGESIVLGQSFVAISYCNDTLGLTFLCDALGQWLFCVISAMLVLSLFCNIFCCISKFCSGKGPCGLRKSQRQTQRHMEENPIYGNIRYSQTSIALFTDADPQDLPLSSSSLRDQHRVSSHSQSKSQDCYANLTLKPPRPQSGRSSPQTQYSDVVQLGEPSVSDKVDEDNPEAASIMSDLYASVQTQRTKTVATADNGEDYANHL